MWNLTLGAMIQICNIVSNKKKIERTHNYNCNMQTRSPNKDTSI
jgi:hypothetical protein